MTRQPVKSIAAAGLLAVFGGNALAQSAEQTVAANDPAVKPAATAPATAPAAATEAEKGSVSLERDIPIQRIRPQDRRGLLMFEAPKEDGTPFTGFRLDWGAAFTQQYQGLSHSNTAAERLVGTQNRNELVKIGNGFNNAAANLYLNAQLAPGIRVALTTYLSSRHHQETWVKDGYLLVDESPINLPLLHTVMKYTTLRLGHFEVNYGDAHFRRSDNGNALYNPLVGNYVMDAFTTEIGGEVYLRNRGFMLMGGVTGGEIRGQVRSPDNRKPSFLAKAGYDGQVSQDLRVRLTGSSYTTSKSVNNTLFTGDRAGSRYYSVLDSLAATEVAQAWSGAIQPGFRSKVSAFVINPFVKYRSLEFFGNFEVAEGRAANETENRKWTQNVGEVVYRFLPREQAYVAARYNAAEGRLAGMPNDVRVNRSQFGGGWFLTPSVLLKAEYVTQKYLDFPTTDIRNGGKFNGMMVEGVIAF